MEDLTNLLKEHEAVIDFLFQAYTLGFFLKPFLEEMNLPENLEEEIKIYEVEFSWDTRIFDIKEFDEHTYSIVDYINVTGVKDDKEKYGLDFKQLNQIKNATLKLNKNYSISYSTTAKTKKEDHKPENILVFNGIREFTLQDFIGAFLDEISFYGYPEDRNVQTKKLDATIEDIKLKFNIED